MGRRRIKMKDFLNKVGLSNIPEKEPVWSHFERVGEGHTCIKSRHIRAFKYNISNWRWFASKGVPVYENGTVGIHMCCEDDLYDNNYIHPGVWVIEDNRPDVIQYHYLPDGCFKCIFKEE